MGKNGANEENTINLGEWEFRKVKDGLDETQVATIINELVRERDDLLKRTDHLSSLTKLAEKTVAEADGLAEDIRVKSQEQANAEASRILGEANAQAERVTRETRELQIELRSSVQGLIGELISMTDGLRERLEALKLQTDRRLSPMEAGAVSWRPSPDIDEENLASDWASEADSPTPENGLVMELEILPPLDIMKIMDIVTYLDSLPEIMNTELIPNPERPSIIVSLREPIPLVDMLRTLPEIGNVESIETTDGEGSRGKAQISLSESAVTEKA